MLPKLKVVFEVTERYAKNRCTTPRAIALAFGSVHKANS